MKRLAYFFEIVFHLYFRLAKTKKELLYTLSFNDNSKYAKAFHNYQNIDHYLLR